MFSGPISNLVAISKSSLIPKNNQRTSQFRVCVLDKNSQPTNFAKETVKLLPSSSAQEEADAMLGCRSTNLLEKHILDLEVSLHLFKHLREFYIVSQINGKEVISPFGCVVLEFKVFFKKTQTHTELQQPH